MKKFTNFLILFALFIINNYIVEDWSWYTKLGKLYYYPFWLIRSILVCIFCPIFLPEYFFKKSNFYKESKKIIESSEFQTKIQTFKLF